jgi:hypothetical protein
MAGRKIIPIPMDELENLELDPTIPSGLRWLEGKRAGKPAGCKSSNGYYSVFLGPNRSKGGRLFKCHRVVWAKSNGTDPAHYLVDHIDRNIHNNNPENLRIVNDFESIWNTSKTIFAKGYTKRPNGKYQVRIWVNGKSKHVCVCDTESEAEAEYKKALDAICK